MYVMSKEIERFSKILWPSQNISTLLNRCPNHEEDCANFCGLLRNAELYQSPLVSPVENFQEF